IHGTTTLVFEEKNKLVKSTTLTGDQIKDKPETPSAKFNKRKVSEDADRIPVAGPWLKWLADMFDLKWGDLRSRDENGQPKFPNFDNEGCSQGAGPSCR